jgi:hypothetical protein
MRRFQCLDMTKAHADLVTFRPVVGVNHGFRQQINSWLKEEDEDTIESNKHNT